MNSTLLRFVLVGGVGFCVDAGLVYILTRSGLSPLLARVPALTAAIVTTWLLNRAYSFRVETPRSAAELTRYSVVALTSAALNFAIYAVLTFIGIGPVVAVALSTICLLFYSFHGYRRFAFGK